MGFVLVVGHGALAGALALTACGGGSSDSPTTPTSNVSTISILGERGSQSFSPNPARPPVGKWSCGATMMVSRIALWQTMGRSTRAT